MVRTDNNFSNFDKNKRPERPSFNSKQPGEQSGFGARMGGRPPREPRESTGGEPNKFGQRNGDRGDRNGGDRRGDRRDNRQRYGGDSDQTPKKQRGPDWIESSEFCRTNIKTGEVKWKEEFWSNTKNADKCDPNLGQCQCGFVHMYDVKNCEGRPMGFSVPSTWKFQSR